MKIKKLQKDYNSEKEKRTEKENCESKLKTQLQIAEVDANVVCVVLSWQQCLPYQIGMGPFLSNIDFLSKLVPPSLAVEGCFMGLTPKRRAGGIFVKKIFFDKNGPRTVREAIFVRTVCLQVCLCLRVCLFSAQTESRGLAGIE